MDPWSRRRTMLASEVIRGLLVALLTLVTLLPRDALPAGVWLTILYGVVFVVNAAGQFFNPARFATIGEIVPGEADRAKAVGLGQATAATAAIIGPPLAAPLLFALGIQWALLINALSYAVSFFAVRSVHFPVPEAAVPATGEPSRKPAWRAEFAAGVKMFAGNRFLVALLTVAVISSLGTGALTPLLVFFMSRQPAHRHPSPGFDDDGLRTRLGRGFPLVWSCGQTRGRTKPHLVRPARQRMHAGRPSRPLVWPVTTRRTLAAPAAVTGVAGDEENR